MRLLLMLLFAALGAGEIGEIGKEYVFELDVYNSAEFNYYTLDIIPNRVVVSAPEAVPENPVMIVVRQKRKVTSWQIPQEVKTYAEPALYTNTSRTLCTDEIIDFEGSIDQSEPFSVQLSTSATMSVEVTLKVYKQLNYFVSDGETYTTTFSPSQPSYFSFDFPADSPSSVLVRIFSNDGVCFSASVQKRKCPVRDKVEEIEFEGAYQTISSKGGIIVLEEDYSDGFHLVFVANGDNKECLTKYSDDELITTFEDGRDPQTSTATFIIELGKSGGDYAFVIGVTSAIVLGICFFFACLTYIFYYFGRFHPRKNKQCDYSEPEETIQYSPLRLEQYLDRSDLKVSDFILKGKRNARKSYNYFWHVSNVATFYGIPVLQLLAYHSQRSQDTGDLDMCYHNYQCVHPLVVTNFNNVFSNISYMAFGLLFMGITFFRGRKMQNRPGCGVPRYTGVYYSMGLALTVEGLMSACYHFCPNQSNFQFDTSFMYVSAALISVKLFQNRHPDLNLSSYIVFAGLGFICISAVVGILSENKYVIFVFTFLYMTMFLFGTLRTYFINNAKIGLSRAYKLYKAKVPIKEVVRPIRKASFVSCVIINGVNYIMAIGGFFLYPDLVDFGSFILYVSLMNAIVNAMIYTSMKILNHEVICCEAIMYLIITLITWGFSLYFLMNSDTSWGETAAESKALNRDCIVLDFYDYHDVWHFLSGPAMFSSMMMIQTLDDDLYATPQNEISCF